MRCLVLFIGVLAVAVSSSPVKRAADQQEQFTADVYKLLKSQSGNFLVCPLSVRTILALVHDGAEGNTATEITSALHLPEDKQAVKKIIHDVTSKLKGNEHYDLTSANKIYVKDGFKLKDEFKSDAVNDFNSEVENVDFDAKEETASKINHWVEEKTHQKIKDLVSKDDFNDDTRAVLLNALYFHGKWATEFDDKKTAKKPFHLSSAKETKVDTMHVKSIFKYEESSELKAKFLEMPYKGDDVTMTFVLPNEIDGLSGLEEKIEEVLKPREYIVDRVSVEIPKFKIESKIEFSDLLQKLGIRKVFSDNAELTGIGAGGELLKVSKVVQKTFIEVEEKGTTAAAATAVHVENIRSGHADIPALEFIADHPFLYYLKSPAGILFIGRYVQE